MATNYPIRFGVGEGLEASADPLQTGLSSLVNASLDLGNVVRKRDGALSFSLTREAGANLTNPVGLWFRGRELAVENGERLYALRTCAREPSATVGNFIDRGRWTRGTLRETVGAQVVQLTAQELRSAVRLEVAQGDRHYCAVEAWATAGGVGVLARNLGDGVEDGPFQVEAAPATAVRGGMVTATSGLLTWQNGDNIRAALWTAGNQALAPAFTAINFPGGDATKAFGFTSEPTLSGGFALWALQTNTTQVVIRARRSSDGALSAQHTVTTGLTTIARDGTSIWYQPTPIGNDLYRVVVGWANRIAGPNARYGFAILSYNVATNTLATIVGPTNIASGVQQITGFAVCGSPDAPANTARFAVEQGDTKISSVVAGGAETVVATLFGTSVVTEFRAMSSSLKTHRNAIVLLNEAGAVDSSAYMLCDPFPLGDAAAADQPSGEVFARSWLDGTRGQRSNIFGVMSLVQYGDVLLWADPARSPTSSSARDQVAISRFTLQRTPSRPAVIGGLAVAAFAGYARGYDSVRTFEQDFHQPPNIAVAGAAGGSLDANSRYTVAVRFEWTDALGRVHRSAPTIRSVVLAVGQQTVAVTINTLQWTERPNVLAVTYATEGNGTVLYRQGEVQVGLDQTTTSTVVVNITSENYVGNEELVRDELGGEQAAITDFCSVALGRLWSSSCKRPGVVVYSTLPVEGLAPGWVVDFLLELEQEPVTVQELEGRAIALQATRISWLEGDVDNLGNGGFQVRDIPAALGAQSHQAATRTPLGVIYESGRGPRLLSRGNDTIAIGDRVGRLYEIEGERVRSAAYDPQRGAVVLVGETSQNAVVMNDDTQRWGTEDRAPTLDVAVSELGHMAYLRVFDVLLEAERATYSPLLAWLHASGGVTPETFYAGRRFRDFVTKDVLAIEGPQERTSVTGAPGIFGGLAFNFDGTPSQALRASDGALGGIDTDLVVVAVLRLRDNVGDLSVCGRQNQVAGLPREGWTLRLTGGVFTAQVGNTTGTQATTALAAPSSALGAWRVLVMHVNRNANLLHLASDLAAAPSVALPAGVLSSSAVPLRLGASSPIYDPFDGELAAAVLFRPTDAVAPLALAQAVKAAFDSGVPEAAARLCVDDNAVGGQGIRMSVGSPWVRLQAADGLTHLGFRVSEALLSGAYEGDHEINVRLFADFDQEAPVLTFQRSELDVALARYAGLRYVYRLPMNGGDRTFMALLAEFDDGGFETSSVRLSRLDFQLVPSGSIPLEADALLDLREVLA